MCITDPVPGLARGECSANHSANISNHILLLRVRIVLSPELIRQLVFQLWRPEPGWGMGSADSHSSTRTFTWTLSHTPLKQTRGETHVHTFISDSWKA